MTLWSQATAFAKDIRLEHSLFALPFGLLGAFWGAGGLPPARVLGLVLLALVAARTAAMGANRLLDADLDAENPRTKDRAIPTGRLSRRAALVFTAAAAAVFLLAAAFLNRVAFAAAPIVLLVLVTYPLAKRRTALSHLWLGFALALAPLGGEVAAAGWISPPTVWLSLGVLLWVAGFDVLYATMDFEFDRAQGLRAIPAALGVARALWVSASLQAASLISLAVSAAARQTVLRAALAVLGAGALLAWEQYLVREGDLSRVPTAFFRVNAWVGWLIFAALAPFSWDGVPW